MKSLAINKNMLRDIADKLPEVTDEMWNEVLEENRLMFREYFDSNNQLSKKTRETYNSNLRQYFYWVCKNLNNKPYYKITKRDFLKYMSMLEERGMSSQAKGLRKSTVSSFNNYIENVVADDEEMSQCKGFRNYTRGLPAIPKTQTYNKIPISREEYEKMIEYLLYKKEYLYCAWVATAFNVGSRRAEIIQFKTEIINYPIPEGQNYVLSNIVRGKGRSVDGKQIRYMVNTEALKYIKLWIENRPYESDYIFAVKYGGKIKPISEDWANALCQNVLSEICQRRINPHLFKSSCITYLLESGVDLSLVSEFVAQHEDTSTTSKFYDLRSRDEEKNKIFNNIKLDTDIVSTES